MDEEIVIS